MIEPANCVFTDSDDSDSVSSFQGSKAFITDVNLTVGTLGWEKMSYEKKLYFKNNNYVLFKTPIILVQKYL